MFLACWDINMLNSLLITPFTSETAQIFDSIRHKLVLMAFQSMRQNKDMKVKSME